MSECGPKVQKGNDITDQESEQLLQTMMNQAKERSKTNGGNIQQALWEVASERKQEELLMAKINERNAILQVRAKQSAKDFASRFKTFGEGVLALLQGSNKLVTGARNSIDYQAKALHGSFFGNLVAKLEDADVFHEFKKSDPDFVRDVYKEMGAMEPGKPAKQVTDNAKAFQVAQIVDSVTDEMVARQNRSGAYIRRMPGYIIRQTHDMAAIRTLGSLGNNQLSKVESYRSWSEFVKPLLDNEKTFLGVDPEKVLRNIHDALYTGLHGPAIDENNVYGISVIGSMADKLSAQRILYFKDADSAFKYNQALGIRDFKEAVLNDIHSRARSIALMENLGPSPEAGLKQIIRELQFDARSRDDAATQMNSLNDWKIQAAMNELTGRNEVPQNPELSRIMAGVKTIIQMSKMGAVILSKGFADKAFMHAELAHQGLSQLQVLGAQFSGLLPRGPDRTKMLRLMGVAMDGLTGNALARYTSTTTTSGWLHQAQRWFYDLNFLNQWTDIHKATTAELMAAHLGEHANLPMEAPSGGGQVLPDDLRNMLSLYDITPSRWDAIRSIAKQPEGSVGTFVLPSEVKSIDPGLIQKSLAEQGLRASDANMLREYDKIETSLRTYLADRVDIAVPTPGVAERKYATWNTQAGTPLGEAVRMLMMFKSFPITVMSKIVGRTIYGRGANSLLEFIKSDHRGKFDLASMIAIGTMAGYMSGVVRDGLKGRTPKPLVLDDNSLNWEAINDAAIRGGSLGLMGDLLFSEYDSGTKNFLAYSAGPVFGQLNQLASMKTEAEHGKPIEGATGKLLLDNAPFINLFYTRPILDYFVLWNLEESLSPGTLRRRESAIERQNHQGFFVRPSEVVERH